MNPGKLDRPLALLARTVTNDAAGSPVETWKMTGEIIWGERVAATGTEAVSSGSIRGSVSSVYRIRYRANLAASDASARFRVQADGRQHDVASALEDEKAPRRSAMILTLSATQGEPVLTSVPTLP